MNRVQGCMALFVLSLCACGGSDPTFTVSATVSGLAGGGLVLQLNGANDLPVSADGTVTFPGSHKNGTSYAVTVLSRPANPAQTCTASPASGTINKANVTVLVGCVTDTFAVEVDVAGVAGSGVTLQLNGGDYLLAASPGAHTFTRRIQPGVNYAVTVLSHPGNPFQECTVANPSGVMPAADVRLAVSCVNTHVLSGFVTGLGITRARTALVLSEPGGDGQTVSVKDNGSFQFEKRIPFGRAYNVAVGTAPDYPPMTCVVSGGTGTMPDTDLSSVNVSCRRSRGKFAYVARFPYAVVGAVIADDGTLSTIETAPLDYLPQSIAVDPSAQFLYVATGFSMIGTGLTSFRINADTGQLTQIGAKISSTVGVSYLAAEPQGRFLLSSNLHGGPTNQGSISVFAIDPQTGQLSEAPGSPFSALNNPTSLAFDATGKYVYTTGDALRAFSIDQTTGALTQLPQPVFGLTGARRVVGTPDGRFLYVGGQIGVSRYLKGFAIQPDGGLQEVPLNIDLLDIDDAAAVDPKGRYIAYFGSNGFALKISMYAIASESGLLSRLSSPDWVDGSPTYPIPGAWDPSGERLFVNGSKGTLGGGYGTVTYDVNEEGAPLSLINASAYDSGDARAIAIR